jgi:alpha,alpha-trehalase
LPTIPGLDKLSLRMKLRKLSLAALILFTSIGAHPQTRPQQRGMDGIRAYIQSSWQTLTRTPTTCNTFIDKRNHEKAVVYFPAGEPLPAIAAEIKKHCDVDIRQLPRVIDGPGEFDPNHFSPHGVLYLPNPYVVPGGMFNEMYGWDSYFIIRGLLLDGHYDLARGMVDNFFYEIEHYGSVLNANRTYFLSRSQPPFLSAMVMAVYSARPDKQWLAKAYSYIFRDYQMWISEPHLAGKTGLSRYYDYYGHSPTPDIAANNDPYYAEVITALASNGTANTYVTNRADGPLYSIKSCIVGGACAESATISLTQDYYEGDRSMRESGFDVSDRFGPYSGETHHFAPVCLNSLLYQTERNLQRIAEILGKPAAAREWSDRAQLRRERMNHLMWNPSRGMFFDWNFIDDKQSTYEYASTFYPLWVGLATKIQARAIIRNLNRFEQPGGIAMSTNNSKLQWDYPYGWAPVNLIAIEGLRVYGDESDANRLSEKFLSMVTENFHRDGTIREKYNVVTRSDEQTISVGYHVNVVGFGWTNGTFLALWDKLPELQRKHLENIEGPAY